MFKISFIIATYNRSTYLAQTLDSLLRMRISGHCTHEIIIVDNNSTDNTKETVYRFIEESALKPIYSFEPTQGVAVARNHGIGIATGDLVYFIDDDVIVHKDLLVNLLDLARHNEFDALGGKVLPLYPVNTPQWIKDCRDILSGPIVSHDLGDQLKRYDHTMYPFIGASMVYKKNVFQECGGFDVNLGVGRGAMGEDAEYFRRIEKASKKIYYAPSLVVHHPVEPHRMTLGYIAKWNMGFGRYLAMKSGQDTDAKVAKLFGVPRYLYRRIIVLAMLMIVSVFQVKEFIKHWSQFFISVGMFQAYSSKVA